jgi:cell division protein FtsQ
VSRGLLTPRAPGREVTDLGARPAPVHGQRPGPARRRPRRARSRWPGLARWGAVAVVAGVLLGAAYHWLETSPRFAVTAVAVHGASRVPAERILEVAGIAPGTRLWRLDPRAVAARLETIPEIRRAEVIREMPSAVTILVEERRPFTLVHAGRLHWLDEEGRALGEQREAVAPPVPVVTGLTDTELASLRTTPGPKTRAALSLIRALVRSGSALTAEISEIDMSRPEGPVLYTVDGVEVRLGEDDWEARLARLEGVLGQLTDDDVSAVDLRFRDQVVLRRGGR